MIVQPRCEHAYSICQSRPPHCSTYRKVKVHCTFAHCACNVQTEMKLAVVLMVQGKASEASLLMKGYLLIISYTEPGRFKVTTGAYPDEESYEIGSRVTLTCSAEPIPPIYYGNLTLPLTYQWYSTAGSTSISTSNSTTVILTTSHLSSTDYFCHVYIRSLLLGIYRKENTTC